MDWASIEEESMCFCRDIVEYVKSSEDYDILELFSSEDMDLLLAIFHAKTRDRFQVMKLSPNAIVPKRATFGSVGYDLYSAEDILVPARGKALIHTDIAMSLPYNCYGRIEPRSGLALHHFIDVGAGLIDPDYHGNVCVLLFNFHETDDFKVIRGERIAQLVLSPVITPDAELVSSLNMHGTSSYIIEPGSSTVTYRISGFGSTGR